MRSPGANRRGFARRNDSQASAWFTTALRDAPRLSRAAAPRQRRHRHRRRAGRIRDRRTRHPRRAAVAARELLLPLCRRRGPQRRVRSRPRSESSGRSGPSRRGGSARRAATLGGALLPLGVAAAARASLAAAGVALAIALRPALRRVGQAPAAVAPLNMAMCRALNLMLGVAAGPGRAVGGVAHRGGAAALHLCRHRPQPRRSPWRLAPRRLVCADNLGGRDRRAARW